jgi:hypothetical protein
MVISFDEVAFAVTSVGALGTVAAVVAETVLDCELLLPALL